MFAFVHLQEITPCTIRPISVQHLVAGKLNLSSSEVLCQADHELVFGHNLVEHDNHLEEVLGGITLHKHISYL